MRTATLGLIMLTVVSGCARDETPAQPQSQIVPGNEAPPPDYGPLFPKINADLAAPNPDVNAAVHDTVAWARGHLENFDDGSCGEATVVFDSEFTRIFGRSTLGVTLPWMQLYIRDGVRDPDPFLWRDPTLFVSTVLHEFVHSGQRARQAAAALGTHGCEDSHAALSSRRPTWNTGFASLRLSPVLGAGFSPEERSLLYRWISPIARARDEVEAAAQTVRWMHEHSDELGELTAGGANNWAYGVQYLVALKNLAATDCFSPDDDAYAEEQRIYQNEIPRMLSEFGAREPEMMEYLSGHNVPTSRLQLSEARTVKLTPSGRQGARCNSQYASQLPQIPQYPVEP